MRHLQPIGPDIESFEEVLDLLDSDRLETTEGGSVLNTNMVMSLDGAFSADGVSAGLSSEADHQLFLANRMLADVILVGAATVREERYRRPQVHPAAAAIRERRGQDPVPRLVITSASLDLGHDSPLLSGDGPPPVLADPANADTSSAPVGVELLRLSEEKLDMDELVGELTAQGAQRITCEGGPSLLGQLAASSLIDEYLLTLSPVLLGGTDVGLLGGTSVGREEYALHRVLRRADHLMCSFRRR